MGASKSLILTDEQVEALLQALQGYRQETLAHTLPTAERNARLRLVQRLLAPVRAQQTRPAPRSLDPLARGSGPWSSVWRRAITITFLRSLVHWSMTLPARRRLPCSLNSARIISKRKE
ncbi:hypothetical protein A4R35_00850 [Thermogemmatispora tikiterensis]|uniref:Uncharacterized protein n=2 Tax=Thermogemmatispora tikiterensis TaxID=1825093 RepID=A0A328VE76_9CHLR|nr:hypothetical protein A4R35_00850 [Thermogemmatispora tikiterensis]